MVKLEMNERLIKLGLDSHMLNYIDNETPRRYFLSAHADEDDLQKFAELIVRECVYIVESHRMKMDSGITYIIKDLKEHFGIET
jgi:hypothetical protein